MVFGFSRKNSRTASIRPVAAVPPGIRIYAVGDIHGCSALLDALHIKIMKDRERNKDDNAIIVYLGDYVDRGPNSAQVLDVLAQSTSDGASRIFLTGNHEDMLLRFLEDPEGQSQWCEFGGFETLMSYNIDVKDIRSDRNYKGLGEELADRMPPSHSQFLQTLRPSFSIGDYFFCHAGVRPGIPLDRQSPRDLMWIRDDFLDSSADHGKVVVHGHSPNEEPEVRFNRINIDTGAYATGRLTALVLEGSEHRFLSTEE